MYATIIVDRDLFNHFCNSWHRKRNIQNRSNEATSCCVIMAVKNPEIQWCFVRICEESFLISGSNFFAKLCVVTLFRFCNNGTCNFSCARLLANAEKSFCRLIVFVVVLSNIRRYYKRVKMAIIFEKVA